MRRYILLVITLIGIVAGAVPPAVEFVTPSIARVRWSADGSLADNATGICIYPTPEVDFTVDSLDRRTVLTSDSLIVEINDRQRDIRFIDRATGRLLLHQTSLSHQKIASTTTVYDDSSAHIEETANGKVTVKDVLRVDTTGFCDSYDINFAMRPREGIYGLGAHMEDYMNLLGKRLYLTQHNLKTFVPVIVSTAGYGLLFDAGCSMIYDSRPSATTDEYITSIHMTDAATVDYYFIKGQRPDDVVGGYRYLSGNVSMLPLYAFGYIQSKERYVSSHDIINTVREYRRRHVPLDMIVQDWNYWSEGWGYMKMNRRYYPDPKALADSVHALDAKLMVSIWANPQYCPQEKDFRDRGLMLEHSVYDAFNPAARDLYWDYAYNEFFSNGFDAWWCDSSEPLDGDWNRMPGPAPDGKPYSWDDHERRWNLNNAILSETLGSRRACLYSLNHALGIYEHQRAATDTKRVVNLTRSSFAGQQRYGTIVWNGDTHASWESFRQQIPAGLNYMATGNPYWTVDIGCFFTRSDPRWFYKGEFPDGVADDRYKEFYTRMLQWAAFLPVMRSHGTDTPREIWQFGEPGTPYYDAILKMINLRYSMLPYIYSMAAMQHHGNYTMARPLAFEFPDDARVHDIGDQYMFGDIMVCPVTAPGATWREVYLPAHAPGWIDYNTGEHLPGGTTVTASTPLDVIPLYVKGGSILISAADPVEHSRQLRGKPLDVTIYPGCDTRFVYYDDSGDGYGFENGQSTDIIFTWNEKLRQLTIEDNRRTYPGASLTRQFNIRTPGTTAPIAIEYTGPQTTIPL